MRGSTSSFGKHQNMLPAASRGHNRKKEMQEEETHAAYPKLNLPPAELRLRQTKGAAGNSSAATYDVFDVLRRRYVRLTPEEWVRQHFVSYLLRHKGYPAGLVGNEVSLRLNGTSRRCDTVVFGRDGAPLMIVEYKASGVALTQKVFDQVARYNIVLRTPWLVVSNGMTHACCHLDLTRQTYAFVRDIPTYAELADARQQPDTAN